MFWTCRRGIIRTAFASVLIALMIITMTAPHAMAASGGTKKMTVYNSVLKKGNTVYCATYSGLYKVKLRNKKVVSKKRLVKASHGITDMKIKGRYLYYKAYSPIGASLHRVNLNTGKAKAVFALGRGRFKNYEAIDVMSYAFKGNKLYAKIDYYDGRTDEDYTKTFVAKLNGKSAKVTSVKVINKNKTTNKKGYKIVEKTLYDDFTNKSYLKTPKGKFYLGKGVLY